MLHLISIADKPCVILHQLADWKIKQYHQFSGVGHILHQPSKPASTDESQFLM